MKKKKAVACTYVFGEFDEEPLCAIAVVWSHAATPPPLIPPPPVVAATGPGVNIAAVLDFLPRLLSRLHVEVLVHGNATATEVKAEAGRLLFTSLLTFCCFS